ncbi:MAG: YjjG family noncanonical pyrimidine nucleotidase [Lachnospiraceae bacterium]|nr:YjjG family noncanonical pyrimidine nucleotidase [Lachnospiraceae bacterium]
MRFDVILWDADNTLLNFDYSQRFAISKSLEEIGVTPTEEMIKTYSDINENWWKRLERGEVTKPQLLTGRFIDLFAAYELVCEDMPGFCKRYQEYLGSIYRYIDNSLEICKSLVGKCRQFVVTNGVTATQLGKLQAAGFHKVMEDIFISEQLGVPKPQKAFFDRVLEKMQEVPLDRILIVGDSLTSDMRGGNLAGIATCWYNPGDLPNTTEVKTDFIIRNLKEVPGIVEG